MSRLIQTGLSLLSVSLPKTDTLKKKCFAAGFVFKIIIDVTSSCQCMYLALNRSKGVALKPKSVAAILVVIKVSVETHCQDVHVADISYTVFSLQKHVCLYTVV